MIGTFAWLSTYGNAAAEGAVPLAATIATTSSSPTSARAAWTVCCGSKALSCAMYSNLRPLMPPSAFIASKAAVAPSFWGMPDAATGPVSGNQAPTLIGPLPEAPDSDSSPPQAVMASAVSATASIDAKRTFSPPRFRSSATRIDLISLQNRKDAWEASRPKRSRNHFENDCSAGRSFPHTAQSVYRAHHELSSD